MSTNVGDRSNFSLVINTSIVAQQPEVSEKITSYLDFLNQEQEIETTCQDCLGTGWKRIVIDKTSGVVRCKAPIHLLERLNSIGVKNKHKHCSFFNYRPESYEQEDCKEMAQDFVESFLKLGHKNTKGLILSGCSHTGKTHLSVAILKELILSGKCSVKFDDFFDRIFSLISDLEQVNLEAFEPYNENEPWLNELPPDLNKKRDKFFYENYLESELLILDNFELKDFDQMEKSVFSHVVAHRYNHSLPLILNTRLDIDELEMAFSSTTFSKLMNICQFVSLG